MFAFRCFNTTTGQALNELTARGKSRVPIMAQTGIITANIPYPDIEYEYCVKSIPITDDMSH